MRCVCESGLGNKLINLLSSRMDNISEFLFEIKIVKLVFLKAPLLSCVPSRKLKVKVGKLSEFRQKVLSVCALWNTGTELRLKPARPTDRPTACLVQYNTSLIAGRKWNKHQFIKVTYHECRFVINSDCFDRQVHVSYHISKLLLIGFKSGSMWRHRCTLRYSWSSLQNWKQWT